jgi:iron(III) transport system permease protein
MIQAIRGAKVSFAGRSIRFDFENFWLAMLTVVVLVLVGIPLATAAIASLRPGDTLPFDAGAWTLANFGQALTSAQALQLVRNTLIYMLASLAVALPIALALAWLVERTDMPLRDWLYTLILIPMVIPGLLQAIGWALLLNPRNGVVNIVLRAVTGSDSPTGPLSLYTIPGLVGITALTIVPSSFLMLAGLLRNINSRYEEAASTSGARFSQTLRLVTLPLIAPGLLTTLLYYSVVMNEFFEIPMAIAPNAQFPVLSLQIFLNTQPQAGGTPLYGQAAAYGLLTLILGFVLLWFYRRATAAAQRFAVIVGKGGTTQKLRLGWARYPALAFGLLYLFLAAVLPVAILVWTSFLSFYEPPSVAALTRVTWNNYEAILSNQQIAGATVNSLMVLIFASTLTISLAGLVAWVTHRGKTNGFLDFLVFLPTALPAIVLALAVMLVYIRTPLWGTVWILVVAQIVRYLPFTTRLMSSALLQIHTELEEAAWISGASKLGTLRRILLPLLFPALGNAWMWVALHSVRDFTFPIMLGSIGNVVLASLLWALWLRGEYSRVGAMSTLILVVSMCAVVIVRCQTTNAAI